MLLKNKKALILGIANDRSLAWGIAQALKKHGAQIAVSYQGEALQKRVEPLAQSIEADFIFDLDVSSSEQIQSMKELVEKKWGTFDILVHSLAFAQREDLQGKFLNTSKAGFLKAMEISAYSLVEITQTLAPLLNPESSIMAMTYYGAEKVIDNYNVMGVAKAALEASVRYLAKDLGENSIRINAISAGPVKTLAASGVSGLRGLLAQVEEKAPLKRNISAEDVGGVATFLASDLAKNVTGQTIYVDAGLSILGN